MSELQPKYPIYIISKGRADTRLTSKTLEELNVPYRIVIEESEFDDYAAHINPKKMDLFQPVTLFGITQQKKVMSAIGSWMIICGISIV